MHALVSAVLLEASRLDALEADAGAQPQRGQATQTVQSGRRERHTVVRTN